MNILILGGAGFIGQHLAHSLLKTRHNRVVVVDNLSTSTINLEEFEEYKNLFEFHNRDLLDIDDKEWRKLFSKQHIIYHLAGSVGVEHIDKNPSETLFNNVNLTQRLIPLFEKYKRHVVFASTSEIYGSIDSGSFKETDAAVIGDTSKLRWGYACVKLMTEFMMNASTFPHTIVRLFNVVGPGQLSEYGMVLPKFVKAAKANEPLTIYGDGNQVRSFCHIEDAVVALRKVPGLDETVYNIGNDNTAITIKDLAQRVIDLTGSTSEIRFIPYEEVFSENHGDIMRRVPDISRLRESGIVPTRTIDDIIKDMI